MSQLDKLRKKLLLDPVDFTWKELSRLLSALGYNESQSGKTSGSRTRFLHAEYEPITLHKPHPKPCLKRYQIKQILLALKERGQL